MTSPRPGVNLLKWASEPLNDEGVLYLPSYFGFDALLVTGHEVCKEILITSTYDYNKPDRTKDFLRGILGDGLVLVEGDVHKFQRKRVQPAFGFRQIKELYPMMWKKAVAMSDGIEADIKSDASASRLEMGTWTSKATLDIIGIAGAGREFNAMKNMDDPLPRAYSLLTEPSFEKFLYFAARVWGPTKLVLASPWKVNRTWKEVARTLRTTTERLVQEKREAMKTNSDAHFDILALLIKTGDFSDADLADQLLTFLAAG